jgi:hypothetical protein
MRVSPIPTIILPPGGLDERVTARANARVIEPDPGPIGNSRVVTLPENGCPAHQTKGFLNAC